jgi:hypothetical protein
MNPQGMDPSVLTFLAGAGIGPLLEQITKLIPKQGGQQRNPAAPSAQLPHRPGMRIGAGGPPGATLAPSMMRALMQQAGQCGPPPGGMPPQAPGGMPSINPQMLLQMLAARGGA